MTNANVSEERSGWRDMRLSRRHRQWGEDCPMVDIDFLGAEYDRAEPKVIVEYKHENAPPDRFASRPNYRTLARLGDRADLPVLVVRYADDFSWFWVTPLNERAHECFPEATRLTEREWVAFLYEVRGRTMPDDLFDLMEVPC